MNSVDANFLTEGDVEPLEELYGKNSEVVAKHINNALAVNSKDIELISYIPGSGLQPPGYRIRVQIPADPANMRTNKDKFGKELTGKTIEVTVGISPAAGSSAKSLVTTKFANINDEGAAIAKAANDYYKYEGFIPSYTGGEVDDKRNPYYNDNEIKGYFKSDGLGKKLYGNKDVKLDVYKDTNTGTFKLRTRDESGFVTNLSNREAFSTIDVTDDRKMAESIQNGAAPAIELLDKIIKQDPQFLNARTRAEQAARAKEILDFLKTSDAPVEASSYQDILNILE